MPFFVVVAAPGGELVSIVRTPEAMGKSAVLPRMLQSRAGIGGCLNFNIHNLGRNAFRGR